MAATDQADKAAYVFFKLSAALSDETVAPLLRRIVAMPEVINVGRLRPKAQSAATRRQCFASVSATDQAEHVAQVLRTMPEIEVASVPSARFALDETVGKANPGAR